MLSRELKKKSCIIRCPNCEKIESNYIWSVKSENAEVLNINLDSNKIVAINKGKVLFSHEKKVDKEVLEGSLLLLPSHDNCLIKLCKDTTVTIFDLGTDMNFCKNYSFEMLYDDGKKIISNKCSSILSVNRPLEIYLGILTEYILNELECNYYLEMKMKEFLYILRVSYSKEELFTFFAPILNADFRFSTLVFKHYKQVKTVKELAAILNYSLSGFEKRFKKVFDISPYQWMQGQMVKNVYYEITCTKRTFTEIAFEYGFSGPSHFNHFCKMKFGDAPGKIRKTNLTK